MDTFISTDFGDKGLPDLALCAAYSLVLHESLVFLSAYGELKTITELKSAVRLVWPVVNSAAHTVSVRRKADIWDIGEVTDAMLDRASDNLEILRYLDANPGIKQVDLKRLYTHEPAHKLLFAWQLRGVVANGYVGTWFSITCITSMMLRARTSMSAVVLTPSPAASGSWLTF